MVPMSETAAALERYSAFVEDVLRPQLKRTLLNRDVLAREVHEYQELQELLHELATKNDKDASLHTLLDVGERFHVRAKVPDISLITVDIGLNHHVEMTVPEAQHFVQKHLIHLTEKRNKWQAKAREVSDHVNVVIASIQQLAALQRSDTPQDEESNFREVTSRNSAV
ncbi:putative prefoldin alpha [Plasmopara halstedii]